MWRREHCGASQWGQSWRRREITKVGAGARVSGGSVTLTSSSSKLLGVKTGEFWETAFSSESILKYTLNSILKYTLNDFICGSQQGPHATSWSLFWIRNVHTNSCWRSFCRLWQCSSCSPSHKGVDTSAAAGLMPSYGLLQLSWFNSRSPSISTMLGDTVNPLAPTLMDVQPDWAAGTASYSHGWQGHQETQNLRRISQEG